MVACNKGGNPLCHSILKKILTKKSLIYVPIYLQQAAFLGAFFIAIALLSYQSSDSSWFFVTSEEVPVANWAGKWGACVAFVLLYVWGGAAWGCIVLLIFCGLSWRRLLLPLIIVQTVMATLLCKHHVQLFTAIAPGGYDRT